MKERVLPSAEQIISVFIFVLFFIFYFKVFNWLIYALPFMSAGAIIFMSWVLFLVNFPLSAISAIYLRKYIKDN